MRIQGLHIDGYGIFHDTQIRSLPTGAVVICGANEAGKSTMLGFVKAILFGFPDGRTTERQYLPLAGGRHGGRLFLRSDTGQELTVERYKGRGRGPVTVAFADGTVRSDEPASLLVPGATRDLFGNIYAFSLDELHQVESLQDDAVRTLIYGASAGSAATSLPRLLSGLEQSGDRLFKPQGSTSTINKLLGELEGVRASLRTAREEMAEYEIVAGQISEIDARIVARLDLTASSATRRQEVEGLARAWNCWLDLTRSQQRLDSLMLDVETFPEEGLARLDVLLAELRARRDTLNAALGERDTAEAECASIVVDETLAAAAAVAFELGQRKAEFQAALGSRMTLAAQIEAVSTDIARALGNLGPEWTVETVAAVDRSLFTRDAINQLELRLETVRRARERADEYENARREEAGKAAHEAARAREWLDRHGIHAQNVNDDTVRRLRALRAELGAAARELPDLERQAMELEAAVDAEIRALGPGWTIERVESFDTSVATKSRIDEFERALASARREIDNTEYVILFTKETVEAAESDVAAAHVRFDTFGGTAARPRSAVEADRARLRSLRNELLAAENLRSRLEGLRAMPKTESSRGPNLLPLAIGLFVVAAIGAAVLGALGQLAVATALFVLFALAGTTVVIAGRSKGSASREDRIAHVVAEAEGELARKQKRILSDWQQLRLVGPHTGAYRRARAAARGGDCHRRSSRTRARDGRGRGRRARAGTCGTRSTRARGSGEANDVHAA